MSSFIVTPYRMRKPSTQTRQGRRGNVQSPVVPAPATPATPRDTSRIANVDATMITELRDVVQSLKREIEEVKVSTISGMDTLRKEMAPDKGAKSQIQQVDVQTKQLRQKLDTLKSEMNPERGVSKRVSVMEAKLTYATNTLETYKDEHTKNYTSLADRLASIDDTIASHPSLQMLSSRMDTIEASIDRLMSTLSGLSQVPVIQKRVTGSRSSTDGGEAIQFGAIHRISPH